MQINQKLEDEISWIKFENTYGISGGLHYEAKCKRCVEENKRKRNKWGMTKDFKMCLENIKDKLSLKID